MRENQNLWVDETRSRCKAVQDQWSDTERRQRLALGAIRRKQIIAMLAVATTSNRKSKNPSLTKLTAWQV